MGLSTKTYKVRNVNSLSKKRNAQATSEIKILFLMLGLPMKGSLRTHHTYKMFNLLNHSQAKQLNQGHTQKYTHSIMPVISLIHLHTDCCGSS